jgi:hypothetical protein
LSPNDIQMDFECEPEAGSYLALDDERRQQAAQTLTQVAMANPDIVDRQKVIRFQMSTIRGIGNPDDYLLPPQPQQPPPPKVGANITIPLDKMPADIVNQLLPLLGMQPSQTLAHRDQMAAVTQAGAAADSADSMMGPGAQEQAEHQTGAEHALEITRQAHDAQQAGAQQDHEHISAIRDHVTTLQQNAQKHQHATSEADQAAQNALLQGAQQHAATLQQNTQKHGQSLQQGAQQHTFSLREGKQQQSTQLKTAKMAAKAKQQPKPNGKPQ